MLLHSYHFFSLLMKIYFVTIACKGVARSVFNRLKDEFALFLEQAIQLKLCVPYIQYFIRMSFLIALSDLLSELISPFENLKAFWKGFFIRGEF